MSNIPNDLRYSEEHEYVTAPDDGVVTVGITDYAQGELGDVVYIDLPDLGTEVTRGDVFGSIEAVKAVSELFAPVTGEIIEINAALDGAPSMVNTDPYGDGWMIKIRMENPADLDTLMAESNYSQYIGE